MLAWSSYTAILFSMSAAQALHTFEKLTELGVHLGEDPRAFSVDPSHLLDLEWPELSRVLPDFGLPRGVTEIAAPNAHGGGTTIALAAIRAAQKRGSHVHCAWIEAAHGPKLHAPEVLASGVDPARLLVVRAPREALARVCVKVLSTGAFALVTVAQGAHERAEGPRARGIDERAVRRFSLAAEESSARVLLLTDSFAAHGPWPISLRLEVERLPESIHLRVARERRGRVGQTKSIPLRTRPRGPSSEAASPLGLARSSDSQTRLSTHVRAAASF